MWLKKNIEELEKERRRQIKSLKSPIEKLIKPRAVSKREIYRRRTHSPGVISRSKYKKGSAAEYFKNNLVAKDIAKNMKLFPSKLSKIIHRGWPYSPSMSKKIKKSEFSK